MSCQPLEPATITPDSLPGNERARRVFEASFPSTRKRSDQILVSLPAPAMAVPCEKRPRSRYNEHEVIQTNVAITRRTRYQERRVALKSTSMSGSYPGARQLSRQTRSEARHGVFSSAGHLIAAIRQRHPPRLPYISCIVQMLAAVSSPFPSHDYSGLVSGWLW